MEERHMTGLKDLKLDDVLDEIRAQASKRMDDLVSEGRAQARRAGGGHDDTRLFSAFTIGLLVGAIAGAAVALLMTPLSGEQARTRLSERIDRLRGESQTGASWEQTGSGNGRTGAYEAPSPVS
jgi:YtxH-like protein